jgi:hypothetical protein
MAQASLSTFPGLTFSLLSTVPVSQAPQPLETFPGGLLRNS